MLLESNAAPPSARRALRRAVEIPCEIISSSVDQPLLHWATDLSPFGMWVETSFPMKAGEVVVVSFQPPVWWPAREITVFARITRVADSGPPPAAGRGMGLELLDLTCHERRALQSWLRGRPPHLPRRRARTFGGHRLPSPRKVLN